MVEPSSRKLTDRHGTDRSDGTSTGTASHSYPRVATPRTRRIGPRRNVTRRCDALRSVTNHTAPGIAAAPLEQPSDTRYHGNQTCPYAAPGTDKAPAGSIRSDRRRAAPMRGCSTRWPPPNRDRPQRRADTSDEPNQGTVGQDPPMRTPQPHADLEPGPPATRPRKSNPSTTFTSHTRTSATPDHYTR